MTEATAVPVLAFEMHCPLCGEPQLMPLAPHDLLWCPEQDCPYPEQFECLCGETMVVPLSIRAAQPNRPDVAHLRQDLAAQEYGWDAPAFDPPERPK